MQSLLTPEQKDQYISDIEKDYARARDQHANKKGIKLLSLEEARLNKLKLQFDISELPKYTTWDSVYTQKTQSAAETTLVVRTSAAATSGIGSDKVTLVSVSGIQTGDTLASGTVSRSVASVTGSIVSLASTINVAIASGAQVTVTRLTGEQNSSVYGVAGAGLDSAQTTSYALTHAGWVGMTTYIDASGSLRVKTETLVAMSGIQTGNTPLYDSNPLA